MTSLVTTRLLVAMMAFAAACKSPAEPQSPQKDKAEDRATKGKTDPALELQQIQLAAIEKVVGETGQQRHQCWERSAAQTIGFSGRIVLRFAFEEPGQLKQVSVKSNTTGRKDLAQCLAALYETHPWPPVFDQSSGIELPFDFPRVQGQHVIHRDSVDPGHTADVVKLLTPSNTGNPDIALQLLRKPGTYMFDRNVVVVPLRGSTGRKVTKARRQANKFKNFIAALLPLGQGLYTRPEAPATETAILVLRVSSATAPLKQPIVGSSSDYDLKGGIASVRFLLDPANHPQLPAYLGRLKGSALFRVPTHTHEGSTEILYVTDGGGIMTVGDSRYKIRAGHAVQVPPGVSHSFDAGDTGIEAIQFYAQPGPEQRFK